MDQQSHKPTAAYNVTVAVQKEILFELRHLQSNERCEITVLYAVYMNKLQLV